MKDEGQELLHKRARILIDRPHLTPSDLEIRKPDFVKEKSVGQSVKGCFSDRFQNLFPPLKWVPRYKMNYLAGDLISGMTVSMIRLPQGLAYGLLAGLAPINGVYLEFFQCMVYSLLSTVPQNSMGTFSVIALMTGSVLDRHFPTLNATEAAISNNTVNGITNYYEKLEMATTLSFIVGILNIAFGLLNLGSMAILLAKPVVAGFTTASAIIVTLAQGTHIFGISVTRYSGFLGPIKTFISILSGIFGGVNWRSVTISAVSIPFLYCMKLLQIKHKEKLKGFPIPSELFLVALTTLICYFISDKTPDLIIVGDVPGGLPSPSTPPVSSLFGKVFSDALPIAIVGYSTNLSLAKIFSARKGFDWSANQEGFALGAAHLVSSFFSCFPGSAALARSSLQESAGGQTHLASFTSATVMLLIIVWIGPIFKTLPRAVLSCIVIVNLRGMFLQFYQLPVLWRSCRIDFFIWACSFLGVIFFGVDKGLLFGIVILLLCLVYRNSTPTLTTVARYEESEVFIEKENDEKENSLCYVKFDGPLNFVSAGNFTLTGASDYIIDFSQVTSIDSVGIVRLLDQSKGRRLHLVAVQSAVRKSLETYEGFSDREISFHATMIDAHSSFSI